MAYSASKGVAKGGTHGVGAGFFATAALYTTAYLLSKGVIDAGSATATTAALTAVYAGLVKLGVNWWKNRG